MLDRANYSLSDFLLFSERVYVRMFELHNGAMWPLHAVAMIVGFGLVAVILRPTRFGMCVAYGALALIWLFVTWQFLLERYADINWAAAYIAPLFVVQAALLGVLAVRAQSFQITSPSPVRSSVGLALLVFSLIGYPLVTAAFTRPWQAAEFFAISPDPTAVATLAFLRIGHMGRGIWIALAAIVPLLWIVITSLTLYTLGSIEYLIAPIAGGACVCAMLMRR